MSTEKIKTKTVSRGVAKTTPITLVKKPNTIIRFEPVLHNGGVKGQLVKYKKKTSDDWGDLSPKDFESHALKSMEKVIVDLSTDATAKLLDEITKRKSILEQGIQDGQKEYVVADKKSVLVINDKNKHQILEQILNDGHSDEYWELIAKHQPNLASKLASGHIQQIRAETISTLKERLKTDYHETSGSDSWQSWIFENHWLFGVNYQEPIEKQRLNLDGIMPDYLFPRIDGFVDLLEIKLPSSSVVTNNASHTGSYRWTVEATTAIGQVVHYLSEIDRLRYEIEAKIQQRQDRTVSMLKPRAYILIGNSAGWSTEKREGLRKLNDTLHGIEVLTYQQLIYRGEAFLSTSILPSTLEMDDDEIPFR